MSPATAARRRALRGLILDHPVRSQQQLVEMLAHDGHHVTQATVSRDLDALGAVKVGNGDEARYEIDEEERYAFPEGGAGLRRALVEFVESIDHSVNLAVLHTVPGAAHLVAGAIDGAALAHVVGTIAGDDTVLAVAAHGVAGFEVAASLERIGAG